MTSGRPRADSYCRTQVMSCSGDCVGVFEMHVPDRRRARSRTCVRQYEDNTALGVDDGRDPVGGAAESRAELEDRLGAGEASAHAERGAYLVSDGGELLAVGASRSSTAAVCSSDMRRVWG